MKGRVGYYYALKKWIKEGGRDEENYISSVLYANFGGQKHNMLVEEENFKRFYSENSELLLNEFSVLEKVDLTDYLDSKYGRTNKKR